MVKINIKKVIIAVMALFLAVRGSSFVFDVYSYYRHLFSGEYIAQEERPKDNDFYLDFINLFNKNENLSTRSYGTFGEIILSNLGYLFLPHSAFAAPPTTAYTPGETLDPSCLPSSTNCTVNELPAGSDTQIQYNNGGAFGGASSFVFASTTGNVGIGTTSPYAKLSVGGQVVAGFFTATTTATSTFSGGLQTNLLNITSASASSTFANGINLTAGCFSINGTCVGGGGGSSFGEAWTLGTNVFSQSSLRPTTTQNIVVNGVGTSTFAGGLEAWRQISAPYFNATSTATSTFTNGFFGGRLSVIQPTTLATIIGDTTGNARGSGAIDVQSGRTGPTSGSAVASGLRSSAFGYNNTASGIMSSASGYRNTASHYGSSAFGWNNLAHASSSAFGHGNSAIALRSLAFGYNNTASEQDASAFGRSNTVTTLGGLAFGGSNTVSVSSGYAFGFGNTVNTTGNGSSAFGGGNTTSNSYDSAFGRQNTASGYQSSAFGYLNVTSSLQDSAFGSRNTASGQYSSAFGHRNTASGYEGSAFGKLNTASGLYSVAFGYGNIASGNSSSAFGHNVNNSIASSAQFGASNTAKLTILSTGETKAPFFTATSSAAGLATSTFYGVSADILNISSTTASSTFSNGINIKAGCFSINGTCVGGGGGSSFGEAWTLGTNVFSQSSLRPTTTQNIVVNGVGTSTFAGGLEAWRQISAPYFNATSTATSTFTNGFFGGRLSVIQPTTLATIIGDTTGNARGSGAIDVQSTRNTMTETASGYRSSAFGNFNTASGAESSASGVYNTASGGASSAFGYDNDATGDWSSAFGHHNIASGGGSLWSSAFGHENTAGGSNSAAFGAGNIANGTTSSAFGAGNTASATTSSAFGNFNTASGENSVAFGYTNTSNGATTTVLGIKNTSGTGINQVLAGLFNFGTSASHGAVSVGILNNQTGGILNTSTGVITGTPVATTTIGVLSTAVGIKNLSFGNRSSAFGYENTSSGVGSFASGYNNTSSGLYASATGYSNDAIGQNSSAFGYNNTASNTASSAFGFSNTASGYRGIAFGYDNTASGSYSSAFGYDNTASALYSSASGYFNIASATSSVAFGYGNTASATTSQAFGHNNTASATSSSAFGYSNTSSGANSVAFGHTNTSSGATTTVLGIGNNSGTGFNQVLAGLFNFGRGSSHGSVSLGILNNQTGGTLNTSTGIITGTPVATTSIGILTTAVGIENFTPTNYTTAVGYRNTASGSVSSAFGYNNLASNTRSSASGYNNIASSVNSAAFGINNTATGVNLASAFGYGNTASGLQSLAFGNGNTASGNGYTSAFGHTNTASGISSTAFGNTNTSSGNYSNAFGYINTAGGVSSSAFGYNNTASAQNSVAFGKDIINSIESSAQFGASDTAKLTILSTGETKAPFFTATSSVGGLATSTFFGLSADILNVSSTTATSTFSNGINLKAGCFAINGTCVGGGGGSSFGEAWTLGTNVFSQSSLRPTTTQNIVVNGVGTSTFAGGLEAWRQISAPYFNATSTATSTFTNIQLNGFLSLNHPNAGATVIGDTTGNTRGAYALDIQPFRVTVTDVASGSFSAAVGNFNSAGEYGSAFGYTNTASGNYSTASGYSNVSSGTRSSAFGYDNTANNTRAIAIGYINSASLADTVAIGASNTASASGAVAVGRSITNSIASSAQFGASNTAKLTILSTGETQVPFFTATSTTASSTIRGFLDVTGTGSNATSTYASNLWVKGALQVGSGSIFIDTDSLQSSNGNLYLSSVDTSTIAGGLKLTGLSSDTTTGLAGVICLDGTNELKKLSGAGTCIVSSERFKDNILTVSENDALEKILGLETVSFSYKNDTEKTVMYGLIAEKVAEVDQKLAYYGTDGLPYTVRYEGVTSLLVNANKALSQKIDNLELRVKNIEDIKGTSGDISIGGVLDGLKDLGVNIASGIASFTNLVAENLTVGSSAKPSGITLYDEVNGDPYCLKIVSGQTVTVQGTCSSGGVVNPPIIIDPNIDTEAPVITLNGNNPSIIQKGQTYTDLGAIVTDNINNNLGINTVGGEIDTTIAGTYTVTYSATDQAGNTATSTRTVVVEDSNVPQSEPEGQITEPEGEIIIETEEVVGGDEVGE